MIDHRIPPAAHLYPTERDRRFSYGITVVDGETVRTTPTHAGGALPERTSDHEATALSYASFVSGRIHGARLESVTFCVSDRAEPAPADPDPLFRLLQRLNARFAMPDRRTVYSVSLSPWGCFVSREQPSFLKLDGTDPDLLACADCRHGLREWLMGVHYLGIRVSVDPPTGHELIRMARDASI